MTPQLEALWQAQELDRALLALRERKASLPAKRGKVDERLATARLKVSESEEKSKAALLAKKNAEKEVDSLAEQERKFQTQLTQVKKNEEYKALLHEIEATRSRRSSLETFVLERMEQESAVAAEGAKAKQVFAEAEAAAGGDRKQIDTEEAALVAEENGLLARRDTFLAELPATLRTRYEKLIAARRGQAVAELVKDACTGCGMRLPPQAAISVRRGESITECPDCGCILVYRGG